MNENVDARKPTGGNKSGRERISTGNDVGVVGVVERGNEKGGIEWIEVRGKRDSCSVDGDYDGGDVDGRFC